MCQAGKMCTTAYCCSSRKIISHWMYCNDPDCFMCMPIKQAHHNQRHSGGPPILSAQGVCHSISKLQELQSQANMPALISNGPSTTSQQDANNSLLNASPGPYVKNMKRAIAVSRSQTRPKAQFQGLKANQVHSMQVSGNWFQAQNSVQVPNSTSQAFLNAPPITNRTHYAPQGIAVESTESKENHKSRLSTNQVAALAPPLSAVTDWRSSVTKDKRLRLIKKM